MSLVRKFSTWVHLLTHKFANSVKRFPEAAFCAAATVTLLILINHWRAPEETFKALSRITMTLALGFPLTLALKVFAEQYAKQYRKLPFLLFPLVLVFLLAYFSCLLKEVNTVTISRYVAYSLVCYLSFLFIPHLANGKHFVLYVLDLFTKFCVTYLYTVTLYLGAVAILLTINLLFTVQISSKLYYDLWLLSAGLFAPISFLGEIPDPTETYEPIDYPSVLRVLFVNLLIPLVSLYTIILYVYFAKILITQTWPAGIVGHLVLWYALFSTLLLFVLQPLRTQNIIIKRFTSLFPWIILPLIAMMFVAMGKRIAEYGLTENRYYVLAAGFWVTGCMFYYGLSRRPRNVLLPLSFALIAFLVVTGPWNSFSLAKHSQNSRFVALLNKYELLEDGKIIPRPDLPSEAKYQISSVIAYFQDNHSLREISILPDDFTISDMEKVFGFPFTRKRNLGRDGREHFYYQLPDEERLLSLDGYDLFVDLTGIYAEKKIAKNDFYEITYSEPEKVLVIRENNRELYSKNIADLFEKEGIISDSAWQPIIKDQNVNLHLRFLFTQVWGWKDPHSGELNIEGVDFYLFIGKR